MARKALFEGLVFDEFGKPATVTLVGDESCYVVNDAGFKRHIPSEQVDRQVLELMRDMIQGNEGLLSEQAAKMLGQDDIFSKAMIENQLQHIEDQVAALFETGIPEEARAFIGMAGFRVKINLHGEVIDVEQPGTIEGDQGE